MGCGASSHFLHERDAVQTFDPSKFMGKWSEVARLGRYPQNGQVTWDYVPGERNGPVRHFTIITTISVNGVKKSTRRSGEFIGPGRMSITTFGAFTAEHYIISLGDASKDYDFAVVSEPSQRGMWILARSVPMAREKFDQITAELANVHAFDLDRLHECVSGVDEWQAAKRPSICTELMDDDGNVTYTTELASPSAVLVSPSTGRMDSEASARAVLVSPSTGRMDSEASARAFPPRKVSLRDSAIGALRGAKMTASFDDETTSVASRSDIVASPSAPHMTGPEGTESYTSSTAMNAGRNLSVSSQAVDAQQDRASFYQDATLAAQSSPATMS